MNAQPRMPGHGVAAAILLIAIGVIVAGARQTAPSLSRPADFAEGSPNHCITALGNDVSHAMTAMTSDPSRVFPCLRAKKQMAPTGPSCAGVLLGPSLVCGESRPTSAGGVPTFSVSLVAARIRLQI